LKKIKRKWKFSRLEKFVYALTILLVVSSPITIVFSKATLSKINFEVERQKKKISSQQKKNESLTMKIDELASLDKIQEIAKENGLSYNNDRIKVIVGE